MPVSRITGKPRKREISRSHGGEYEAQTLLGCTAVFLIETSVDIQLTWQYIPEESELQITNGDWNGVYIKSSPTTYLWRRREEMRYSSYSFTTSALERGEWSASRPGRALPSGKGPRYPLYRRLGGPQNRSGHRV
jgi:hypothetical protein